MSAGDWWATTAAAIAVPVAALALHTFGYNAVSAFATRRHPGSIDNAPHTRRRWMHAVARVRHFGPYKGNCLSTSIALLYFLRGAGVDARLRLGTRFDEGQFRAHAWVEANGSVLNDTADVAMRYQPFTGPPTSIT